MFARPAPHDERLEVLVGFKHPVLEVKNRSGLGLKPATLMNTARGWAIQRCRFSIRQRGFGDQ